MRNANKIDGASAMAPSQSFAITYLMPGQHWNLIGSNLNKTLHYSFV